MHGKKSKSSINPLVSIILPYFNCLKTFRFNKSVKPEKHEAETEFDHKNRIKVCIVHVTGLSTTRGGGIANKVKSTIIETKNEVDYSILTYINQKDYVELRALTTIGVDCRGIHESRSSLLDCRNFVKNAPTSKFGVLHFHEMPFAYRSQLVRYGLPMMLILLKPNFRGTPVIFEHQISADGLSIYDQTWRKIIFKVLYPLWKRVIVNSKYMQKEASKFCGINPEKITLIRLGIDSTKIRDALPIDLRNVSLVFFGHLSYTKGVDLLIRAFGKVSTYNKKVHLHLVGDGELRKFCEDFAVRGNFSERVHFWGSQPQEILFGIIKGADICVLPSRAEAAGYVVLEAMAAGKPIISTNVGGIPEYIKNGRNGIIVDVDLNQLVRAIEDLLSNLKTREEMSKNNLLDIKMYSLQSQSRAYVQVYRSVVNSSRLMPSN
jgi:glycosyltransferase involved in cell wall biosynthesis